MMLLLFFTLLNYNFEFNQGARILAVFPIPSISHQSFFRTFTHELARRGHEVTVITTDPAFAKGQAPPNLIEIDMHSTYDLWRKYLSSIEINKASNTLKRVKASYEVVVEVFKDQITRKEVHDIILKYNGDFDMLLLESCFPLSIVFSQAFKVPVIQISSIGKSYSDSKIFGISSYPLLYPSYLSKKSHNLTISEIIKQMYDDYYIDLYTNSIDKLNKLLPVIFGKGVLPLDELKHNIHMLLLNAFPSWINNQPLPMNVVQIGGIHKPSSKEIPEDLQAFLDTSNNGVIYFSFGTNVKAGQLSKNKLLIFIRVFSKLPYNVLWKWDKDSLPDTTEKIKTFKWLPQPEVLRHPNVRLFITQGGLQSTDEAISAGVPLIGIPMFADQWYNSDNYVYHKIGTKLDLESLTEDQLKNAIENIITNESYYNNIKKLRIIMEDQPQSALERALWWTEHVLRHGGEHLRVAGANITWIEYYELELIIIGATILICISILIVISISLIWRFLKTFNFNIKIKNIIKKQFQ